MKKLLPILLGFFMIFGAIGHVYTPETYSGIIPPFIPETLAHIFATVTEAVIGIALLFPKYRRQGGLGFFILMLVFLPLHVWDVFRENPMMGSTTGAFIRLGVQFLFIYAGWWIKTKYE
jgi:uncharacterized membrane protein